MEGYHLATSAEMHLCLCTPPLPRSPSHLVLEGAIEGLQWRRVRSEGAGSFCAATGCLVDTGLSVQAEAAATAACRCYLGLLPQDPPHLHPALLLAVLG